MGLRTVVEPQTALRLNHWRQQDRLVHEFDLMAVAHPGEMCGADIGVGGMGGVVIFDH